MPDQIITEHGIYQKNADTMQWELLLPDSAPRLSTKLEVLALVGLVVLTAVVLWVTA